MNFNKDGITIINGKNIRFEGNKYIEEDWKNELDRITKEASREQEKTNQ